MNYKVNDPKVLAKLKEQIENKGQYLESLKTRNHNTEHINYKIYYLLEQPFTYVNAYAKVSKNLGALTKGIGSDEEMMKYFGLKQAVEICQKIKEEKYNWSPTRRTWVQFPGKKKLRPIDTPTQEDRIVQEAIKNILEAIYEPEFIKFETENNSRCTNYGFRPSKSTFDAVNSLKYFGQGCTLALEGDIEQAYPSVNHEILMEILQRRIKDKKFLKLIRNLLKAGIMDQGTYKETFVGTPQGGIVSPLLFNIYMFEFDKFIHNTIMPTITTNTKPRRESRYQQLGYQIRKIKSVPVDKLDRKARVKLIKKLSSERMTFPSYQVSSLPKTCVYSRYADDWVLLFTGTTTEGEKLRSLISEYLQQTLKLKLSEEKTIISRFDEGFDFLGFNLRLLTGKDSKLARVFQPKYKIRTLRRTTSRKIIIKPSKNRVLNKLYLSKFCNQQYYPIGKYSWSTFEVYDIVLKYRQIMTGLYTYYSRCDSCYLLNRVEYILRYSCAKTIASRLKITMAQVFNKYGPKLTVTGKIYRTTINNSDWFHTKVAFPLLKELKQSPPIKPKRLEPDPFRLANYWRTKHKIYDVCCICGSGDKVALHHLNSLRKIKTQNYMSQVKSQLNRKQIPVCHSCHMDITHGRYNKDSPILFYNEFLARL